MVARTVVSTCRHCGAELNQDGAGRWVGPNGRSLCFTSSTPGTPDGQPVVRVDHVLMPEITGPTAEAGA